MTDIYLAKLGQVMSPLPFLPLNNLTICIMKFTREAARVDCKVDEVRQGQNGKKINLLERPKFSEFHVTIKSMEVFLFGLFQFAGCKIVAAFLDTPEVSFRILRIHSLDCYLKFILEIFYTQVKMFIVG